MQRRTIVPLSPFGRKCLNRTLILFVGARRLTYVVKFRKKADQSGRGRQQQGCLLQTRDPSSKGRRNDSNKSWNPWNYPTRNRPAHRVSRPPPRTTPPCTFVTPVSPPLPRPDVTSPSAIRPRQTSDVLAAVVATTVITVDVFVPRFIAATSRIVSRRSLSLFLLSLRFAQFIWLSSYLQSVWSSINALAHHYARHWESAPLSSVLLNMNV